MGVREHLAVRLRICRYRWYNRRMSEYSEDRPERRGSPTIVVRVSEPMLEQIDRKSDGTLSRSERIRALLAKALRTEAGDAG